MMTWREFIRPTNLTPVMDEDDDILVVIKPSSASEECKAALVQANAKLMEANLVMNQVLELSAKIAKVIKEWQ